MFRDKKQAFRCAKQAAAAKEYAQLKANKRFKRGRAEKKPYEPGKLGPSAVSVEIMKEFDKVLDRKTRRRWVFTAFYNGEGPIRVPHDTRPSKYAGARR